MRVRTCGLLTLCLAATWLGGCQTMRKLDATADAMTEMGKAATTLADESVELVRGVGGAIEALDQEVQEMGAGVREAMPQIREDTAAILSSFEKTSRELGQATTETLQSTSATMDRLGPELKTTLVSVRELVESTRVGVEKVSTRLDESAGALERLADTIDESADESAEESGKALRETQVALMASLTEAQAALAKTGSLFERVEGETTPTLQSMRTALDAVTKLVTVELTEDDERGISEIADRIDALVRLGILVLLLGGVMIVATTALFIQHKLTTRKRHEAMLVQLGLLDLKTAGHARGGSAGG